MEGSDFVLDNGERCGVTRSDFCSGVGMFFEVRCDVCFRKMYIHGCRIVRECE